MQSQLRGSGWAQWKIPVIVAVVLESALLGLMVWMESTNCFGLCRGADNPLFVFFAFVLQFPTVLAVLGLIAALPDSINLSGAAIGVYLAILFLGQSLCFAFLLRRRAQRKEGSRLAV
jgi:hypothetical protein